MSLALGRVSANRTPRRCAFSIERPGLKEVTDYGSRVRQRDLTTAVVVGVGGLMGALARYGADTIWPWRPPEFPFATWTVNIVGCLAIGLLLVILTEGPMARWWLRPLLAVGVLGGFTTYSSFAVESVRLVDDRAVVMVTTYVVTSLVVGLLAVWLSATMTRRLLIGRQP